MPYIVLLGMRIYARPVHWFVKTRDRPAPYPEQTVVPHLHGLEWSAGLPGNPPTKETAKSAERKKKSRHSSSSARSPAAKTKQITRDGSTPRRGRLLPCLARRPCALQHLLFFPFLLFPSPNQLADPQNTDNKLNMMCDF